MNKCRQKVYKISFLDILEEKRKNYILRKYRYLIVPIVILFGFLLTFLIVKILSNSIAQVFANMF